MKITPQNLLSCPSAAKQSKIADPFLMIIFGGGGDLSCKQLIPSIFRLFEGDKIKQFTAVGIGRTSLTDINYRDKLKSCLKEKLKSKFDEKKWKIFAKNIFYQAGDASDPKLYKGLCARIAAFKKQYKKNSIIYYLSVQPSLVCTIVNSLSSAKLCRTETNAKIVLEKPFGHNRKSAAELNKRLSLAFDEKQIYRIDHYLGKETVQNILFFRFANTIFEPLWNRNYISHIEITVSETIGIENRGAFYEETGIIRDMVQNHIMQLLALVTMEPPVGFDADLIRDEKVKALQSVRILDKAALKEHMVIGQYGRGKVGKKILPAYRAEAHVNAKSNVPTYFAGRFFIDNWRFGGVPIYVRTGKRLAKQLTQIVIQFKHPPLKLFKESCENVDPNRLMITISPHEEIALQFGVKSPGSMNCAYPVNMVFDYQNAFKTVFYSAYERLLLDCMRGDLTLFARHDGIDAMWSIIDPILSYAEQCSVHNQCFSYPSFGWGPKQADQLIEQDGYTWINE
jgi:glucose-6-phosphate 1-dehydrogenase